MKIFQIAIRMEIVVPSTDNLLGLSWETLLIVKKDFKSFPCVFDIVPVRFKIMVVVICLPSKFQIAAFCNLYISNEFSLLLEDTGFARF